MINKKKRKRKRKKMFIWFVSYIWKHQSHLLFWYSPGATFWKKQLKKRKKDVKHKCDQNSR